MNMVPDIKIMETQMQGPILTIAVDILANTPVEIEHHFILTNTIP